MAIVTVKCPKCGNMCDFNEGRLFGFCNKCGSKLERNARNVITVYDRTKESDEEILFAWERFEAWLKTQTINGRNGWTAFSLAQNIADDHPLFGPIFSAAKEALDMDDATAEAMLAAAEEGGA